MKLSSGMCVSHISNVLNLVHLYLLRTAEQVYTNQPFNEIFTFLSLLPSLPPSPPPSLPSSLPPLLPPLLLPPLSILVSTFSHADIKTSPSENGQFSDAEITIIDNITRSRSKCEEKPLLKSTPSDKEQPSTDSKVLSLQLTVNVC